MQSFRQRKEVLPLNTPEFINKNTEEVDDEHVSFLFLSLFVINIYFV